MEKYNNCIIKEAYVSFEVAKLLKEKGFNEPIWTRYEDDNEVIFGDKYDWNNSPMGHTSAPTHQMAMRWLREVHGIHIQAWCPVVDVDADTFGIKYNVVISNLKNKCIAFDTDIDDNEYNTYEEAVEAALKYVLQNLI